MQRGDDYVVRLRNEVWGKRICDNVRRRLRIGTVLRITGNDNDGDHIQCRVTTGTFEGEAITVVRIHFEENNKELLKCR